MNVTVTRKYRDKKYFEGQDNSVLYTTTTQTNVVTSKTIISFTATSTPTISNYQDNYGSTYGEHPIVILKTIDGDGNYIIRNEQAKYTMSGGLLNSISWDLPDAETGFIILS